MFSFLTGIKSLFGFGTREYSQETLISFEKIANIFGTHCAETTRMLSAIDTWNRVFQLSKTQMMKTVCHEAAKLTLTDVDISLSFQSEQAEQVIIDTKAAMNNLKAKLCRSLEVGIALGGMVIKPTLNGFDLIAPNSFVPISFDSEGKLMSAIFISSLYRAGKIYKKFEYHRFVGDTYVIDNKAYAAKTEYEIGSPVRLSDVPEWAGISEHTEIDNLEHPLFAYFRMPGFNNIDETSYSGISLCSSALEYLQSYDNVFDGFKADLETTRKVVFVRNSALLNTDFAKSKTKQASYTHNPIPNLIVGLGDTDQIKEFNPSCNVDKFKIALQMILDLIATSCGFTTGYFSFDNTRKAVTATQIESEDQITVATISSIRQNLKSAILEATMAYIDILKLYSKAPTGLYDITFYARDLTVTPEADKAHTFELVKAGYYPLELYLKEYEGFSDDDIAKYADKIPFLKQIAEQKPALEIPIVK